MSEARAKEFIQWLSAHPEQQTKLVNCKTAAERRQLREAAGFGDITGEEVEALLSPSASGALSDEQLQTISGGLRNAQTMWD